MVRNTKNLTLLTGLFAIGTSGAFSQSDQDPNIIYIYADDLGYGELGAYGQEKIETPNIDKLAENGIRFTQHYSGAPVCAPARSVLLTGLHSGHTPIRGNDEWDERGDVWNYRAQINDSTLEGQKPLPGETMTIARKLSQGGYRTGAIGKWGLGAPHTKGIPTKQGFDYFFGYNCQRQAHTYYPVHLYENENRVYLENDTVPPHTELPENADPYDKASYEKFTLNDYAPDLMFEHIKGFIQDSDKEPFFLYWATPIPHVPIQAPQRWVDHYVDKFGDEEPYTGKDGYFPHRYPRAGYAAMISYLDERVGQLIQHLKDLGLYENTLIIFSSDNGPTFTGGADTQWFNSGRPFQSERGRGKGFLHEGGIRVPMIAAWPGEIEAGTVSDHVSVQYDVFPTLCEVAGVKIPENTDGISFLPELTGKNQPKHDFLYWEFPGYGGQLAVRFDDYKILAKDLLNRDELNFEVYNLNQDPDEENNIADKHPELIQKAKKIIEKEHRRPENEKWQFGEILQKL
ncbi:MAG: arylsulfatase [Marinilabilia sp.]